MNLFLLNKWSYLLDLIVMPLIMIGLLYASPAISLGYCSIGFILWTLAEYFIHRVIFHHFPYFEVMHDVHHKQPKAWVGIATYGTALAFALVWMVVYALSSLAIANCMTAGLIFGYLFYSVIHIQFHHGERVTPKAGPFAWYINFMADFHNGHHRGGKYNFGVTSPVWDIVFRTYN